MRTFNSNFLWCALLLLSLILLHISRRKAKVVNLNNRIFRDIVVLGLLDVVFELVSNGFIARCTDSFCIGAVITTNVFFLFQAILPFSLLCYIRVLIENRRLSARELLVMAVSTLSLAFIILTVYLYSLGYVNKAYGMQGGDAMLQHIAKQLQSVCGTSVFRLTGKRFLILAESMKEYDEDLSGVRALFEGRGTDAPGVFPVILCGVSHAERMGSSGDVMAYVEYLDGLPAPNGSTCVVQANANTMRSFL